MFILLLEYQTEKHRKRTKRRAVSFLRKKAWKKLAYGLRVLWNLFSLRVWFVSLKILILNCTTILFLVPFHSSRNVALLYAVRLLSSFFTSIISIAEFMSSCRPVDAMHGKNEDTLTRKEQNPGKRSFSFYQICRNIRSLCVLCLFGSCFGSI